MFGRSSKPTRHLLIGNAAPGVGIQRDAIAAALAPLGCISVHVPQLLDKEACYAFATFESQSAAANALKALHQQPCSGLGGRVLTAKYAAEKRKGKAPEPEQVHVCRTSEECGVPGLHLLPDFVPEAQEQELLDAVEAGPWDTLARRRVKHFGFEFRYLTRDVDPQQPIAPMPAPVAALLPRLLAAGGTDRLDQLTVNEYGVGVGLSPHIDTHSSFTGAILSLSLAGPAVMQFRRGEQRRALFLPRRSLLVLLGEARYAWDHYIPHRQQDVVDGEAIERALRRVSLTFRQVRGRPCCCEWTHQCDSQLQRLPPTRNLLAAQAATASAPAVSPDQPATLVDQLGCQLGPTALPPSANQVADQSHSLASSGALRPSSGDSPGPQPGVGSAAERPAAVRVTANGRSMAAAADSDESDGADPEAACQRMEDKFVNEVYNAIAPHFNSTRFAVWPKVRSFLETFSCGDVMADVGCGNGKYFGVRRDVAILASDRSVGLAEVAATRLSAQTGRAAKADVAVADAFALPYRAGSCDGVLCIAVLHHIASKARRLRLLQRLCNILRPGGRALVTVWAYEQEQQKLLAKWQRIPHPPGGAAAGRPGAGDGDSSSGARGGTSSQPDGGSAAGPAVPPGRTDDGSDGGSSAAVPPGSADDDSGGSSGGSLDYMVPWHLPFHRLEAAAVAASTVGPAAAAAGSRSTSGTAPDAANSAGRSDPSTNGAATDSVNDSSGGWDYTAGSSAAAAVTASPAEGAGIAGQPFARIDAAKNTIVFERYYHLFRRGELEALAAQVPCAAVVDSFYDKSNWCIVLQREVAQDRGGSNASAAGAAAAAARIQ